jgi:hypothetical protein
MKPEEAQQEEVPVDDATVIPVGESEEEMMPITQKEMMACPEKMEACLEEKEPTSVETKPGVAQREVPNEDAVVKPVEGRKKRHRAKKQAAGRRGEPKKLTRGDCGSRMKLAAACRKGSCHATVAWRKKIFRKSWTQRNCGLQKEVTASMRKITRCAGHRHMARNKRKGPECNTGIRDRGLNQRLRVSNQLKDPTKNAIGVCRSEQQSHRGRRGTRKMIFYEIVGRKLAKQTAGSSVGLRQDKDWTLWRGRPPPKRKKGDFKQRRNR